MNTRKDFVETAKIISTIKNLPARIVMGFKMAEKFAEENPRFNRQKFYTACNIPLPK